MLKTTASRLAAFSTGLALAAGSAAAIGAATGATPPFQDCLKVAAANAGFGTQPMADAGHGAAGDDRGRPRLRRAARAARRPPARPALPDSDRRRVHDLAVPDHRLRRQPRPPLRPRQHQAPAPDRRPHGPQRLPARPPNAGRRRDLHDRAADRASRHLPGDHRLRHRRTQVRPRHHPDRTRAGPQHPAACTGARELGRRVRTSSCSAPRSYRPGRRRNSPSASPATAGRSGDLEPYLGSYGHLVALHAPELAYSHVHPISADPASGAITFNTELSEHGTYRLFLQFQTHGRVHTVAFTQTIS